MIEPPKYFAVVLAGLFAVFAGAADQVPSSKDSIPIVDVQLAISGEAVQNSASTQAVVVTDNRRGRLRVSIDPVTSAGDFARTNI